MSDDTWQAEKKEYTIYPNHLEPEDYLKVLLCEDVIFVNNGWWKTEKGEWPADHITVHVNCNDVFVGGADAEDILYGELWELYEMYKRDPDWGPAAWCIKKRKMKPQRPVEKHINEAGIWNIEELINGPKST